MLFLIQQDVSLSIIQSVLVSHGDMVSLPTGNPLSYGSKLQDAQSTLSNKCCYDLIPQENHYFYQGAELVESTTTWKKTKVQFLRILGPGMVPQASSFDPINMKCSKRVCKKISSLQYEGGDFGQRSKADSNFQMDTGSGKTFMYMKIFCLAPSSSQSKTSQCRLTNQCRTRKMPTR